MSSEFIVQKGNFGIWKDGRDSAFKSTLSCNDRHHRYMEIRVLLTAELHEDFTSVTYLKRPGDDLLQSIFDSMVENWLGKPTPLSQDDIRPVYHHILQVHGKISRKSDV